MRELQAEEGMGCTRATQVLSFMPRVIYLATPPPSKPQSLIPNSLFTAAVDTITRGQDCGG
jgi:hypothetical protein